MYVYKRTESQLWTVGYYDPSGKWQPESDWGSPEEASARVCILNGGNLPYILALQKIANAKESDWGYDHPEQKMVQFARSTLGNHGWQLDYNMITGRKVIDE